MKILGISAFYHDSAACLLNDGEILAAAQEERFTRIKHDASFPENSIEYCLAESGISGDSLEFVVFYEKPFPKFERLLETYIAFAPKGYKSFAKSMPIWLVDKLYQKRNLIKNLERILGPDIDWESKILFSEHHLSHAASAFYPSPFESAAILTMDGVGEWATTSLSLGKNNEIKILKEIHFPHSLGLLYSAFTYFTGFKVNSGEYKLMGLAPYGEPKYVSKIYDHLIDVKNDGTFRLNMSYFDFHTGLKMTNAKFADLFEGNPRKSETELTQRDMDLAASIQQVTEEIVVKLGKSIAKDTGEKNICLAGGVALNCVANGKLLREGPFQGIWIQPASGDAGGAIGAAMSAYFLMQGGDRKITEMPDGMKGAYLGPGYNDVEIRDSLTEIGAKFRVVSESELIQETARALADGLAVGWHQGRMEFGPRALGNRSILANPSLINTQRNLNLKIKFRESFRPFAPSILRSHLEEWFEISQDSPYMLLVAQVAKEKQIQMTDSQQSLFGIDKLNIPRSSIPAVTHVDYSARIQTVHSSTNPRFHSLLERFYELTGIPILVNTSFNIRGEPIVESPKDAFKCFMGTEIDLLAIGNNLLLKSDQPLHLVSEYRSEYGRD